MTPRAEDYDVRTRFLARATSALERGAWKWAQTLFHAREVRLGYMPTWRDVDGPPLRADRRLRVRS